MTKLWKLMLIFELTSAVAADKNQVKVNKCIRKNQVFSQCYLGQGIQEWTK